ncbi:unnamed protein product [Linum trigynum]|uniref:Pentatricopeptide repeat-containing protein-mitochondrial domain-containing protein n=1 Tax=Linum trigynum TaxID=586398 RepID=A0AAV2G8N1_9ROSI
MIHTCTTSYSHCHSSKEISHESFQARIFAQSKFRPLHSPSSQGRVSLGFNQLPRTQRYPSSISSPQCGPQLPSRRYSFLNPSCYSSEPAKISCGFKLRCQSNSLTLPSRSSSFRGKKRKYGGVIPSILRSLESAEDIDKTLHGSCENLSAKEQTVILKEQRGWEKVVIVFEFFKSQKDYVPNAIHYNIVLRALGRAQKWDDLRLCWVEMAKSGVFPTNNTYGMLVDVYGKAGLVQESLLWIKHMKHRGLFPDEVTMNSVIKVLKDAGEFDRADRFYRQWCVGHVDLDDLKFDSAVDFDDVSSSAPVSLKYFLSTELFKTGGRVPTPGVEVASDEMNTVGRKPRLTSTYNTLIDLYGKSGRLKDAADTFAEMLKSGVAMDTITFNTMIFTCGTLGHLSEAESLLKKMEERRIPPDTTTYNIFISLHAEAGNVDAAINSYRKIREVSLSPDSVTYRTLLLMLCERHMVGEMENIIEEMEKTSRSVDQHSMPGIIRMYIDEGLRDRAKIFLEKCLANGSLSAKTRAAIMNVYAEKGLWAEAEAIFHGKRDGARLKKDVLEYNVMVKAYGKAKLYDKALSLFRTMRNHGTWPDECTYNSVVQMLSGGDLVEKARSLLAEMKGAGFKPQCSTFSSVIACYVRLRQLSDAVSTYQEMLEAGVKPNVVVYGALIDGFAESGNVEEALRYFSVMEETGVSPNQIVLTSLLKVYSKLGCFDGAKQIYEKTKLLEGGPDSVASNSMISLYAEFGMVSEAEMVFNGLKEKGLADEISYGTMMYLYKSMGMLDKAIDVADEMKQSGLLSDCISYNKAMLCYSTNGQLRACGELLHEMIEKKLSPDGWTFSLLFTILKKGGVASEAVKELESSYLDAKPYAAQSIIASVFSMVGLHSLALESCEGFTKAAKVVLDRFAYNVAIYVYGLSGKIDKALNMFMRMQDDGVEPDIVTHINLVHCYGKAGMVEGLKRVYTQLKYGEIERSESMFKALVDAYRIADRDDLAEMVDQDMRFGFDSQEFSDSESHSQHTTSDSDIED